MSAIALISPIKSFGRKLLGQNMMANTPIHSNDDLQRSAHCASVRPGPDDRLGWTYLEGHQRWYGGRRFRESGQCRFKHRRISASPDRQARGKMDRPRSCLRPTIWDLGRTSGLFRATSTRWIRQPCSVLFTYGPTHHIGVDAENEIDIEFSQWNKTCHGCDADFTVYPSTGNRKPNGISSWEDNFQVSGGNLTTARMEWRSDRVVFTLMNGVHPIGSVADVIKTETYSSNTTNIPQTAAPVGINLWCFKGTPSKNQSAIIRDFRFVPH